MPETAAIPNQCPHCKIIDPMSGVYCIHCGLLMSSQGVTGEKATPGAAAVAGVETMLHCPNCGGGNSRENSVCGWCDAALPWAQNGASPVVAAAAPVVSEPVAGAPGAVAANVVAARAAAAVGTAPPAVVPAGVPPVASAGAPLPAKAQPVIEPVPASVSPAMPPRPRAWVIFAGLTGFALAATLIVWTATRSSTPTVVVNGAPAADQTTGVGQNDSAPAPDVQGAAQAASDAQAELLQKTDAAQKAAAQANVAAKKAADARKQLDAAKAQAPKDAAALAAAQDKAKQAQAEAEDAQAKADAAQAETDAANARADQAAKDADAAVARAKAAEDAAKAPVTPEATPTPDANAPVTLAVRFVRTNPDSVRLKQADKTASVEMRLEAVVSAANGDNISRAYGPNIGHKSGLVTRVYYDVRGPNEELVAPRRPVQLRWDGGISLVYAKSVEIDSPAQVASLLPAGTYTFRIYRNANDMTSMGQSDVTLTS